MSFEGSGISVSGGLLVAAAVFVGGSLLAGYTVAKRQIEMSGWPQLCEAELVDLAQAELDVKRRPREIIPEKRCNQQLDGAPPIFGDHRTIWNGVCEMIGNPDLNKHARDAEKKLQDRIDALNSKRLAIVQSGAGSQCGCAVNLHLQEKMIPNAIYAGSLRTVSLPAVENREAELRRAARSPACAVFTEQPS